MVAVRALVAFPLAIRDIKANTRTNNAKLRHLSSLNVPDQLPFCNSLIATKYAPLSSVDYRATDRHYE